MKKIIIICISGAKVEKLAQVMRQHFPESEIISTTDSSSILSLVPDDNSPCMLITGQALIGEKRGFELIQEARDKNQHIVSILISRIKPNPSHADYVIQTISSGDAGELELDLVAKKIRKNL
jgi:hypothetical protein